MITALLFDIEGTIGDISFVRDVLFPYSRARLAAYLSAHWLSADLAPVISGARDASGKQLTSVDETATQFLQWIDEDRKVTPLKSLQGKIWREGYASGELRAHLYADAVDAMRKWHSEGKQLYIYSSGSIEAQVLYLRHSVAGDLTPLVSAHFDTTSGPKAERASYLRIQESISHFAENTVFFSDAPAETDAAAAAGMGAIRIDRKLPPESFERQSVIPVAGSFGPLLQLI
jgi:enolase-phosphatase E1